MNQAVFLDRDGVINRLLTEKGPRETPTTSEEFELLPDVIEALSRLKQAGLLLVVVTNQPNVAKGKSSLEDYQAINRRMDQLLGEAAKLDGMYACLHHPDPVQVIRTEYLGPCICRKPQPGLLLQAASDLMIDLDRSWLVGDDETDIQAGRNAGLMAPRLIKIDKQSNLTEVVSSSLLEAALHILRRSDEPEQ